jgi:hypothetical protein
VVDRVLTREQFYAKYPAFASLPWDSPQRRQWLANHEGAAAQWSAIRDVEQQMNATYGDDWRNTAGEQWSRVVADYLDGGFGDKSTSPAPAAPGTTSTAGATGGGTGTTGGGGAPAPTGYDALSASDKDWVDELTVLFKNYGLEELGTTLVGLVQNNYAGSALSLALQGSDAYHTRFAANEARKKAGLGVLSPAEYLATERQFGQVMREAGFPPGFYDDPSDFQRFLENDTSVKEISDRAQAALGLAKQTDPEYRRMLAETFGVGLTDGDIAAYFLDQKRAVPILQRFVNTVGIADAARRQGLTYSQARADQLAQLGITGDQAQQAYGQIATATEVYSRANAAFGGDYTQTDAEDEALLGSADARAERELLDTTFKGYNPGSSSRKSSKSLSADTTGSY